MVDWKSPNVYDTAVISIRTGIDTSQGSRSGNFYADLRGANGELLINATLEHVLKAWRERRTPATELAEIDHAAYLMPRYNGSGKAYYLETGFSRLLAFDQQYARDYITHYRALTVKALESK